MGELRYRSDNAQAIFREYLAFPGVVYAVDFYRRTIRTLFKPPAAEIVTFADRWEDLFDETRTGLVVSTDKSFYFLTLNGSPIISVPRVYDRQKHGYVHAGPLDDPPRYFVWYQARETSIEPHEFRTALAMYWNTMRPVTR